MSYRVDKLVDGQTDAHTGNDNTQRPKLTSGKNPSQIALPKKLLGCLESLESNLDEGPGMSLKPEVVRYRDQPTV